MSARKAKKPAREATVPLDPMTPVLDRLIESATRVRERAYAPYSKYRVGAAFATESGLIYAGCNVENASYPAGICAERGAIAAMVAAGDREPIACAIVTEGEPAPPCGMCRQVMVELARKMPIVIVGLDAKGRIKKRRMLELSKIMPEVFELEH